ncbi:hypothetical protein AM218_09605 [Hymenobacter sp. DG25A]|nr:hypothetical protein AM218_09605 [Hymenobacter sp. DG25A]
MLGTLSSCEKEPLDCGCTPPPRPTFTSAQLTQATTWRLDEMVADGNTTRTESIKDRFSLAFKADGTYTQTLLADNTVFQGTWTLTDAFYSTLNLTDHKGALQQYSLARADDQILTYGHLNKDNKWDYYIFTFVK